MLKRQIYFSIFIVILHTININNFALAEEIGITTNQEPQNINDPIPIFNSTSIESPDESDPYKFGTATTSSEGIVDRKVLDYKPIMRTGELLEAVPGMVVTQHSGDGKANQFFLRGFNLDHGTDFATYVEGMPVNMRTHAHGQGYTDLNFIIPELVKTINYKKGVYFAEEGDFSSAGAAHFKLTDDVNAGLAKITIGEFNYKRGVIGKSLDLGAGHLLLGSEVFFYDGPWDRPNDVEKFNATARYNISNAKNEFSLLALAYTNDWNSTDQIPERAISQDIIGRFGNLDNTLGGKSNRYSLSGNWKHFSKHSKQNLNVYGIAYDLDLFSNFTYFLDDPINGDQFEQFDKRKIVGSSFESVHDVNSLSDAEVITFGVQQRSDFIEKVGLYNTKDRQRTNTVRSDGVREHSIGFYLKHENELAEKIRTVSGIREDVYYFDVDSNNKSNSGNDLSNILSPKLNLILGPFEKSEFYVSGGYGFHSNDARGVTTTIDPKSQEAVSPVTPLVRTKGAETGIRTTLIPNTKNSLSFWLLDSDSELVFVGDAGSNEPSGSSRRQGIEFTNSYFPISQVSFDLNLSFSQARFKNLEEGNRIPGALEQVVSSGLSYDSSGFAANGDSLFSYLRFRYFSPYPLIEDNSVRASDSTLLNGRIGYRFSGISFTLDVFNILNSKDNDIQYYYASRLNNEPASGVDDRHIHPFEPQSVRFSIGIKL